MKRPPFPVHRSRPVLGSLLGCALALLSCSHRPSEVGHLPARSIEVDPPIETARACAEWRWIGLMGPDGGSCPKIPGWRSNRLFEPTTAAAIPSALAGFCLFEHGSNGGWLDREAINETSLESEAGVGVLVALERDCMAIGPAADPLQDLIGPDLERRTLASVGAPTPPLPLAARPSERVRLAALDTAPTNSDDPWMDVSNSAHGFSLISLADRILGRGFTRLTSQLALPYTSFDPSSASLSTRDEVRGGYVGGFADLARAVRAEVEAWRESGENGLVLNLSLGWAEGFGGTAPTAAGMNLKAKAVYQALEDAVCRGAIVLAAAGNHGWGPDSPVGPLYPASWETRPAPTATQCRVAGAAPRPGFGRGAYRPLVHAVGGIDDQARPLSNSRPKSQPRLVAFGDHALVSTTGTPMETKTLTGTSVSTVVVSAAAAAVWTLEPPLGGSQVVDRVYRRAADLGRASDFCLSRARVGCGRPGLSVRRVTVAAAAGTGSTAATAPSGFAPSRLANARQEDLTAAGGFASYPECRFERYRPQASRPGADPCPRRQFYDLAEEPWIGPQPGSNMCPNCTGAGSSGLILVAIDPDFRGTVSSVTVSVGSNTDVYGLGRDLTAGEQVEIRVPPFGPKERVFLSATVDGDRSVNCPVLVTDRP